MDSSDGEEEGRPAQETRQTKRQGSVTTCGSDGATDERSASGTNTARAFVRRARGDMGGAAFYPQDGREGARQCCAAARLLVLPLRVQSFGRDP